MLVIINNRSINSGVRSHTNFYFSHCVAYDGPGTSGVACTTRRQVLSTRVMNAIHGLDTNDGFSVPLRWCTYMHSALELKKYTIMASVCMCECYP